MIQNLEIYNYKSINELRLNCSRLNVLIGEPNTGKSNILEALDLSYLPLTFEETIVFTFLLDCFFFFLPRLLGG